MAWSPDETFNKSVMAVRQMLIATMTDPLGSSRTNWIFVGYAKVQDLGLPLVLLSPFLEKSEWLDGTQKRCHVRMYARVLAQDNYQRDRLVSDLVAKIMDNADTMEAGATYPASSTMVIEGLSAAGGLEIGYDATEKAFTGGVVVTYSYLRSEA